MIRMDFIRYRGFVRCAISAKINYRAVMLLNCLQSFLEIAASFFLWKTLFARQAMINGYSWNDMIFYIMISFIMTATLGYGTESNISRKVLEGSIIMDLAKPLDFQNMCFAETVGSCTVEGIIAIGIGGLMACLIGDVTQVFTLSRFGLFLLSFILGFVIKFCLSYFAGLCCFFTSNGYGVIYLRQVITDVFSGALLPISFYPKWFQMLGKMLPFQSVVYLPSQIFLGRVSGVEAARTLGVQLIWAIAMWIICHLFFRVAIRKVTIQGG